MKKFLSVTQGLSPIFAGFFTAIKPVLLGLILSASLPVFAENLPENRVENRVEILAAEFGVFETNQDNQRSFEASAVVARKTGQGYGWMIAVQTTLPRLSVREEYLLPSASVASSENSLSENTIEFSFDRRNQVSQRVLVPVDGIIYGEWEVGPAEPAGQRKLRVTIEDQAAVEFAFEVK